MGIEITGGMIVGRQMTDIKMGEEVIGDWNGDQTEYLLEECGMDYMSPHYDSDPDCWVVGYQIKDVECWDRHGMEFTEWLDKLERLSDLFYEATGVRPKLIGTQDVT